MTQPWKPARRSLAKLRDSIKRDLQEIVDAPAAPSGITEISPLTQAWGEGPELPASPARNPPEIEALMSDPTRRCEQYVLAARIGQGASGEVWKSWDLQLQRWVAVKMLKFRNPHTVSRFIREARAAARLTHPNLVAVYGTGTFHGIPYIAMQLAEGARLQPGMMELRRAVDVVRDAARAVECAHQAGIVHRDLKPDNLVLDPAGRVFVTDFGLAHLEQDDRPGHMTGPYAVVGTPAFMSPEQARGETDRVGPSSDIFSLGATLSYLISGRYVSSDLADTAAGRITPAGNVPRDLAAVLSRALAPTAVRRYATAGDFADDLDRFLQGKHVAARPAGSGERTIGWISRNRFGVAAAGAVVAGLAGWALYAAGTSRWESDRREVEQRDARRNLAAERLEPVRIALEQWEFSGRAPVGRDLESLGGTVRGIAKEFPDAGDAWIQAARLHWMLGEFEKGEQAAGRALALKDSSVEAAAYYYRSRIRLDRYCRAAADRFGRRIEPPRPWRPEDLEADRAAIVADLRAFQKCRSVPGDDPRKTYVEALLTLDGALTPDEFRKAAASIERSMESPTIPRWDGYYQMGRALASANDPAAAVEALTKSIDSCSFLVDAVSLRGSVRSRWAARLRPGAEKQKLLDLAQADYERILAAGPNPYLQVNRANILVEKACLKSDLGSDGTADLETAIRELADLSKILAKEPLTFMLLGRAQLLLAQDRNGRDLDCIPAATEAIANLERAMELDPSYPGGWMYLGSSRILVGIRQALPEELERAAEHYSKAIEIRPDAVYWSGRGLALQFAAKFRKDRGEPYAATLEMAIRDTLQALTLDPASVDGHINLGWCYMVRAEWALAAEEFRKAQGLDASSLPRYEDHLRVCDARAKR